ncbi:quinohemoprotein amine dehydrogenase subunit alpha [Sulfitobacter sp. D35]|uniref:quinohemoprotein amine dehydrogenase subunit alpha n=1 Tax=Sulfitobacter sp. D35 TaxID=3083252 RepID=UPI00296EF132|nr:quinohemoprotein amine dehydrogenase subunit alpha [Sulfitobacter sp. D35]MDW4497370.1 quinohemoprotein amine dehydrogenase subunit alpha [Sulfitobacter sp. D35]
MTRLTGIAALAAATALTGAAASADEALLEASCGGCHAVTDSGLSRIAGQRKTPEGWLMTIVRMRIAHDVDISEADQSALVSYLSDTQGMAPSETADWRYALQKDPAHVEQSEEPMASMCGRCHTVARAALQRRTADEWMTHMHFHVGQFPTIEYQALGRDREWFRIATEEIAPYLAETYPLETEAWSAWQAAEKPQVAGDWVVLTDLPEHGAVYGVLSVSGDASPYALSGSLTAQDGSSVDVGGQMNLYTGYEWRGSVTIDGTAYRQVLAVSEDGSRLEGRQFRTDDDSLGGMLSGAKAGGDPVLLGVVPEAAAPGTVTAQAVGVGLDDLGAGSTEANAAGATVTLEGAAGEVATLAAGGDEATVAFFDAVDRLTVEPAFTIARVGGGSDVGPAPVPAQFKAIGWWNGPDGQPETEDDIRVGALDADWSVENHNEMAAQMEDAKFAGTIEANGIFMPAVAGPNPERPFSTNNAGDLKIVAEAGGQSGEAQLIVTVQRFIDPPIR